jgi:hypothetical protein
MIKHNAIIAVTNLPLQVELRSRDYDNIAINVNFQVITYTLLKTMMMSQDEHTQTFYRQFTLHEFFSFQKV